MSGDGQQLLLPRRAKQLAQEANEKVFASSANKSSSESTVTLQKCVCDCDQEEIDLKPANRKLGVTYNCQAVESVGGSRVGCRNKVIDFRYRQTGLKANQKLLCDKHIKRLKAHQACVFCGEFCAHVSCILTEKEREVLNFIVLPLGNFHVVSAE